MFLQGIMLCSHKVNKRNRQCFCKAFHSPLPLERGWGEAYLPSFLPIFCWRYAERLFESVVET